VKGVKQFEFRSGNWLSAEQSSEALKHACGESIRAKRDYAMLAMLFGCGFRRSELVGLELDEIQGHWAVVDLIGKGGHIRTAGDCEPRGSSGYCILYRETPTLSMGQATSCAVPMNFRLHAILPPAAMLLRRFPMPRFFRIGLSVIALVWFNTLLPGQAAAPGNASSAERGLALAQKGRCKEALPLLKTSNAVLQDKQLKYRTLMATARCAMALEQTEPAVEALLRLNREFPHDPEVLYTATHFYSQLATMASQELAATAPTSSQTELLEGEAYESQEKWDAAMTEYQKILGQYPNLPSIHYRIARVHLSKSPPETEQGKAELEEELKIDPTNASAEFMLGEMARQAGQWDEAIRCFSRATDLDEGFQEAYLALGMSLNSAGKFAEAISPLGSYVKMQPDDPAGHYQLATAYARTGRKQDAAREMELQQKAAAKSPRGAQR